MIIWTTIIIDISCRYQYYENEFNDFAFSFWPTAITVDDISRVTGHFLYFTPIVVFLVDILSYVSNPGFGSLMCHHPFAV